MHTWLITGSSRGFGRAWAEAALERGDRVVASCRNPLDVADLVKRFGEHAVPVELDVTDRDRVGRVMREAHDRFDGLDVVVNNAGYGLDVTVEDMEESDVRASMETNLFGALWVTQAAARLMRPQGRGLIVQMSTQGGHMAHAGLGAYHAAKWALEGLTESVAHELRPFGVRTVLVEPGAALTEWFGSSLVRGASNAVYDEILAARWGDFDPADMPTPRAIVDAAMQALDADRPPSRILLTDQAYDAVTGVYAQRLADWQHWEQLSRSVTPAPS